MKRLLTALALTLGLVLGTGITADATPHHPATTEHATTIDHGTTVEAPARVLHAFDNRALWSCAWGRDNGYQQVYHAVPDDLGDGWVRYRCWSVRYIYNVLVESVQYWVILNVNTNQLGKPWASQDCMAHPSWCQWPYW